MRELTRPLASRGVASVSTRYRLCAACKATDTHRRAPAYGEGCTCVVIGWRVSSWRLDGTRHCQYIVNERTARRSHHDG